MLFVCLISSFYEVEYVGYNSISKLLCLKLYFLFILIEFILHAEIAKREALRPFHGGSGNVQTVQIWLSPLLDESLNLEDMKVWRFFVC